MNTDLKLKRTPFSTRMLLSCMFGVLPFLVLPITKRLIRTFVLPNGTTLQQDLTEKVFLAAVVLIGGLVAVGAGPMGLASRIRCDRWQFLWLIPASFIVLNLSRGQFKFENMIVLTAWSFCVAIWEECYCRGIQFEILRPLGSLVCIVVSTFWFGVIHFQSGNLNMFAVSMIGLGLASAYARTGTLVPAILVHLGINLSSGIVSTTRQGFSDDIFFLSCLTGVASLALICLTRFFVSDTSVR